MFTWKEPEYNLVTTEKQLIELSKILAGAVKDKKPVSVDTESTGAYENSGLDPYLDWLLSISFAVDTNAGWYIPLRHTVNGELRDNQLTLDMVKQRLCPILESGGVYIGHNLKHDYRFLLRGGINLFPVFFDTMIAQQMLHGGLHKSSALKDIITEYVMIPPKYVMSFSDAARGNAAEVDPVEFVSYAVNDVIFTYYLYLSLKPEIDSTYLKLFYEVEMPLVSLLAQQELRGIEIDDAYYERIKIPLVKCRSKIEKYFLEKYNTNLSSPQQVGKMLDTRFDGIDLDRHKETGSIVTDVKAIQGIKNKYRTHKDIYKVAKHILTHRAINKALNTYIDKYPAVCHQHYENGVVKKVLHTSFKQILNTGRMASSPNIQNITKDTSLISIRRGFVARKGCRIVEADWSGMELRIGAVATKDTTMLDAFTADPINADLHTKTARGIYKKQDISKHERFIAKKINFAIFYGATPFRIAAELECTKEEATRYVDGFYETYPGVLRWKKAVEEQILNIGYSETLYGRRRYISKQLLGYKDDKYSYYKYSGAIRELTNHVIQGTSADILKLSLVRLSTALAKQQMYNSYIITSTHDSIVVETNEPEKTLQIMKSIMEITIDGILLPVDIEIKDNFAKAE